MEKLGNKKAIPIWNGFHNTLLVIKQVQQPCFLKPAYQHLSVVLKSHFLSKGDIKALSNAYPPPVIPIEQFLFIKNFSYSYLLFIGVLFIGVLFIVLIIFLGFQ